MMKTSIERLGDDTVKLDVEVPATVVQQALNHTLVELGRDMNVPGFRPGKVPPQAVLARLGREGAVTEAVRHHIGDWYMSAVSASGVRPIADPEIKLEDIASEDHPVRFTAEVQVAPKPKLPDLAQLEVAKPELPDTGKYVASVLDATLRGAGELVDTGEPAKEGDEVLVDFTCTVNGEQVEGASAVGYQAAIGDGRLLDDLEAGIVGHTAGEELEIEVDFEDDHPMEQLAGEHATFHVKLREVLALQTPELSDEVAQKVSEFDTADDLRSDVEKRIVERLEQEVDGIFRGNAVAALAEAAEVNVPPALVERRQAELFVSFKQQLTQHGMTIESYLDRTGQPQDELFADLEKQARDDVLRELSLLSLAEDADIGVTDDDLAREISEHALANDDDPQEAVQRVFASGRADMLRGELIMQRAVDHLVAHVKPVPTKFGETDDVEGGSSDGEHKGDAPATANSEQATTA